MRLRLLLIAAIGLADCSGPQPFLREGNTTSAEIVYAGDVAATYPIAKRHCAEHGRVPRLVEAGVAASYQTVAHFACDPP